MQWFNVLQIPAIQLRFWSYVDLRNKTGCWPWTGEFDEKQGIPQFNPQMDGLRIKIPAHRACYIIEKKFLPMGKEWPIRRVCKNKECVRPDHLVVKQVKKRDG